MAENVDNKKPFYSKLSIQPSRISNIHWSKGCINWLLGLYYLFVQKESTIYPGQYCTVVIRGKGILMTETVVEANVNEEMKDVLTKYKLGIPSELNESYPVLSEILRPGGPWNYEEGKVSYTFQSDFPAGERIVLNKEREQKADEFITKLEAAVLETKALLEAGVQSANAINNGKKIEFISHEDLNLPQVYKIDYITIRYCENRKSAFWGTKNYIFQMSRDGRIFTVYLLPTTLESKCKIQAYLRDIDTDTISVLTTLYSANLPEEFKKCFPITAAFIRGENLPSKMSLCYNEVDQVTDQYFPLEFNRPVPDSVFKALPVFVTMTLALVNELGSFRRTALYRRLRQASRKKDNAQSNALLRRIAVMGIGFLIGSSFDIPDDVDTDGGSIASSDIVPDSTDTMQADTSITDTGDTDTSDTTDGTDAAITPQTAGPQLTPPTFAHPKPGYLFSNPFGDPDQYDQLFETMHATGQMDDNAYNSYLSMKNHFDAQIEHAHKVTESIVNQEHVKVRPIVGPSPEDWDRFDSYESTRENAVDAYHDALDRGDLDEANRQADIARNAQRSKEGIYSVQYTPQSIDKRAGLS